MAGFSALSPGCHITPHAGYAGYSDKILRSHLGLIIPEVSKTYTRIADSRWVEKSVLGRREKCSSLMIHWLTRPGTSQIGLGSCCSLTSWRLKESKTRDICVSATPKPSTSYLISDHIKLLSSETHFWSFWSNPSAVMNSTSFSSVDLKYPWRSHSSIWGIGKGPWNGLSGILLSSFFIFHLIL